MVVRRIPYRPFGDGAGVENTDMFSRYVMAVAVTAGGTIGCQSYQRKPLAMADYIHEWDARLLDVDPVRGYAASLARNAGDETPFNIADGLSLHEAQAIALHFNPQLRIARAEAHVPLTGAQEAGWRPDPRVEAEILRFLDRRKGDDFIDDPWIIEAGLSVTIPLSGRLAVEKELRWSQYNVAWRGILEAEQDLLTRLRAAWLEWSASQERLTITRDYIEKLESVADMAQTLMSAGRIKPMEARLLLIETVRRRAAVLLLEGEVEQNRLALMALLGLSPHAPVSFQADLSIPRIDVPTDQRREVLLNRHWRIKIAEANYERAEQQLRLEIQRQYPDLDIGPSYSLEEDFERFGLGFGLPIPLWNRNRQAVAETSAAREAARLKVQTTIENVTSTLTMAESRLHSAQRQRAIILEQVAPLVEKQMEDSRTLLELGEVDVLLIRDALTGSLETRLDLLDTTLAQAQAANEIRHMLRPQWFTPSAAEVKEEQP